MIQDSFDDVLTDTEARQVCCKRAPEVMHSPVRDRALLVEAMLRSAPVVEAVRKPQVFGNERCERKRVRCAIFRVFDAERVAHHLRAHEFHATEAGEHEHLHYAGERARPKRRVPDGTYFLVSENALAALQLVRRLRSGEWMSVDEFFAEAPVQKGSEAHESVVLCGRLPVEDHELRVEVGLRDLVKALPRVEHPEVVQVLVECCRLHTALHGLLEGDGGLAKRWNSRPPRLRRLNSLYALRRDPRVPKRQLRVAAERGELAFLAGEYHEGLRAALGQSEPEATECVVEVRLLALRRGPQMLHVEVS